MRRFRSLSDLRICIFDPDGFSLSSIRRAAASSEIHEVAVHATPQETLDALLSGRRCDALVIHWTTPFDQGLSLCQVVRAPGRFPNPFLPILMISASAGRQHLMTARNAGVDEFLASPFRRQDFEARLRAAVFERRPFIDVPSYFGPDRRTGEIAGRLGIERRQAATSFVQPPFRP